MIKPGHIVLLPLPVAGGGRAKLRPAVVLVELVGKYQDILVCGISTRLENLEDDWDERIDLRDSDFVSSGLRRPSAVRLSYLYSAMQQEIQGSIGRIDRTRLARLRKRLADRLRKSR